MHNCFETTTDMTPPPVSCMCLTYGRPHLLEEAIASFLAQDYVGIKELVVLNDCEYQSLHCDHPEVIVVNVPRRFKTVGEKRNACAALALHEYLFVWDDDDLSLPHRLSYSMQQLKSGLRFFKSSSALDLNSGKLGGPVRNLFHGSSCFSRSLFNDAHGYPHMGSGQDLALEGQFRRLLGPSYQCPPVPNESLYFIYRWNGTGSFHLSAFGKDVPGKEAGQDRVAEFVKGQIQRGDIPQGEIALRPGWNQDYATLARTYIEALSFATGQ